MAATKDMESSPFVRQLASSDKRIRDRAVTSLRTYLQRKTAFSPLELRKLWKGLFYCMWMSDKPRNQQLLAQDLAQLLAIVAPVNFVSFTEAFWLTMAAEWDQIDRLRMDKFLYLIRCCVSCGFEKLKKYSWGSDGLLNEYLDTLKRTPFDARDAKIPNGLRYHVIEIYVDELDKVDTMNDAPIDQLMAPLKAMKSASRTKVVREKVDEALSDRRLRDWPARADLQSSDEEAPAIEDEAQSQESEAGEKFDGFGD